MTSKIYFVCLLGVALINLAPAVGVFAPSRMSDAYGVDLRDPKLMLLIQHRAVLFGIVGGFMLFALFSPSLQIAAMVATGVSMASFLVLMQASGASYTVFAPIAKVDIVGLILLIIAAALRFTGVAQSN